MESLLGRSAATFQALASEAEQLAHGIPPMPPAGPPALVVLPPQTSLAGVVPSGLLGPSPSATLPLSGEPPQ
eukprot:408732-Alexandrium_andersonii.AAC.1